MFAGMILGAALVIAALMLLGIGQFVRAGERQFLVFPIVGLAIAATIVAIAVNNRSGNSGIADGRFNTGVAIADIARASTSLRSGGAAAVSAPQATTNVAPVPSLLEGLERRLEANPDNPSGWALLAQSYAFVGSMDGAEAALARAIALGFDETDLRARIASAKRDPHDDIAGPINAGLGR